MQGRENPVNPSVFPDSPPENCTAVPEKITRNKKIPSVGRDEPCFKIQVIINNTIVY